MWRINHYGFGMLNMLPYFWQCVKKAAGATNYTKFVLLLKKQDCFSLYDLTRKKLKK
jgi:hypothetical protein